MTLASTESSLMSRLVWLLLLSPHSRCDATSSQFLLNQPTYVAKQLRLGVFGILFRLDSELLCFQRSSEVR